MKVWNHAAGEPWAITESALSNILAIAARQNETPEAVSARLGRELENTQVTQERDGVAIIPVVGPLFRYANLFTAISGASSYEILAKDFTTALDNPDINGIVLDIDSPGGEVNGCAEFASMIFEARGRKPIVAYASGDAASGAYWIASACDEIVVSDTSSLGSIGVVAVYQGDKNKPGEAVEIVSSQSPFKRLDPQTDEGRTRLQKRIDAMAEVFVEAVARHRGVDPPTVKSDFGRGDVFVGQHAVQQGMADQTGTLERTIAMVNLIQSPATERGSSFIQAEEREMDLETLQTEHPQLVASLVERGHAEGLQEGLDQGCQQERERIGAIVAAEPAKGREKLAHHLAFSTDMPADMVLAALEAAPQQDPGPPPVPAKTPGFEQVMGRIENPVIEPAIDEEPGESVDAVAKRIAGFSAGGVA